MPTIHVDCQEFTPTKITTTRTDYLEEEAHQIIIYYYNQKGQKYIRPGDLGDDAHGLTMGSSQAVTAAQGFKIIPSVDLSLQTVTKNALATCTKAYLYQVTDEGTEVLKGTATFVDDEATFSEPLAMYMDKEYYVLCDSEGISFTAPYAASPAYPITDSYIEWTTGAEMDESITDDSAIGPIITQLDFGYESLTDEAQCREYLEYIKNQLKANLDSFEESFQKVSFGTIPKPTRHAGIPTFVSMLPMNVHTYRR